MHSASRRSPVALITGSATGIGKAIALQLCDDGHDIVINDLQQEAAKAVVEEITARGRRAIAICGDVTKESFTSEMIDQTVAELGGLDVAVANAGINIPKPFLDFDNGDLQKIFSVNVYGLFHTIQAAARQMIKQGHGGRIINAASAGGKRGVELLSAYSATKFATIGITQSAAMELAKHNITVNAYCPGAIDTGMWEMLDETIGGYRNAAKGETLKNRIATVPLGRMGLPADVAQLVSFLASDKASYITGQSIVVDGGVIFS